MTTLTGYTANPALYREVGIEAQPGDQVEIYLDQVKVPGFPEFIVGTIQNPVTVVCGGTSYPIEYDETDLAGSGVEFIEGDDILSVVVVSEARVLFGQCIQTIPQSLTDTQKLQAQSNIGSEFLTPPYDPGGDQLVPLSEYYLEVYLTLGAGGASGASGNYEYRGTFYGSDIFTQVGASLTIDSEANTFTGSGRAIFFSPVVDSGGLPRAILVNIVSGSISEWIYTEKHNVSDPMTKSVTDISVWVGDDDAEVSATWEIVTSNSPSATPGLPGQHALGWTGTGWGLFMCYQTNPIRWKLLTQ